MLHQSDLSAAERAVIEAAVASDPALAAELEAIAGALGPRARARFWSALAADCPHRSRPAAAVLAALERGVLG